MLDDFVKARDLKNIEPVGYNQAHATCPVGNGELLFQWNAVDQVDFHCDCGCPRSEVLAALGLAETALHPAQGEYRPLAYGWWKESPRYAAGPVRPQPEQ